MGFIINPFWNAEGIVENFQSYSDGGDVNALNGGSGWAAVAIVKAGFNTMAIENFQSYTDGGDVNAMNGGTNWAAVAIVYER